MDAEAISYLGHLPQDLIGNSVLDFYHPEDMDLLKDIYESGTNLFLGNRILEVKSPQIKYF